jgi:hypothetical protein
MLKLLHQRQKGVGLAFLGAAGGFPAGVVGLIMGHGS